MLWIIVLYQMCKYLLSVCGLSFHSLEQCYFKNILLFKGRMGKGRWFIQWLILSTYLLCVKHWIRHWSHKIKLRPSPEVDPVERGRPTGEHTSMVVFQARWEGGTDHVGKKFWDCSFVGEFNVSSVRMRLFNKLNPVDNWIRNSLIQTRISF